MASLIPFDFKTLVAIFFLKIKLISNENIFKTDVGNIIKILLIIWFTMAVLFFALPKNVACYPGGL